MMTIDNEEDIKQHYKEGFISKTKIPNNGVDLIKLAGVTFIWVYDLMYIVCDVMCALLLYLPVQSWATKLTLFSSGGSDCGPRDQPTQEFVWLMNNVVLDSRS